jgi:peptidoglycan/xylan/chitin deacetylase (PgdA/CDA1 family)
MAVSPQSEPERPTVSAVERASTQPWPVQGDNDGFSFWKLPEQWRASLLKQIAKSREHTEHYLFERYLPEGRRHPPSQLKAYYLLRRFLPKPVRHQLNEVAIRLRKPQSFPAWPIETKLVDFWRTWIEQTLEAFGVSDQWHIGFWPDGNDRCIVLTHDVETAAGMKRIEQMCDLEAKYGFRSSWNLPLEQFHPIDWKLLDKLRMRGFEIGSHGLSHNGKLFRSHRDFLTLAPHLDRLSREHGLIGFRSPGTLRQAEWIQTMPIDFDESFCDTEPWEPQAGGTCSIFPFFLGPLVELPYTLPQDHTFINVLKRDPIPVWNQKVDWLARQGGMILTLTHPDYIGMRQHIGKYEELLKHLNELESAWRALPSQVAAWWRQRAALSLSVKDDRAIVVGADTRGAVARRLSSEPLLHSS